MMFKIYIKIFSQVDFALNSKLQCEGFLLLLPIFTGNSRSTGISTSGRQNTVKTAPQPLFVNNAFVALYVGIILPIGPIPISLFVFELEAKD